MQISVLKPTKENIQKLEGVISYVYRVYNLNEVEAYIIKDDGEIGFVFYGFNTSGEYMGLYINNKAKGLEFTAFSLDEKNNLNYIGNEEYRFYLKNNELEIIDSKSGMQYMLKVMPLKTAVTNVDFNSYLIFRQYNPVTDYICEIQYAQNLNFEREHINVVIDSPENIFIDSDWSKIKSAKKGLVLGKQRYFSKIIVEEYNVDDMSVETCVKYIPIKYITNTGDYLTFGHLSKKYDIKELSKFMESKGFMFSVPNKFVNLFQKNDYDFRKLSWIVSEVENERVKEENDKGMVFRLAFEDKN